ncbi:MAG: hypothetical protein P1V81_12100 [Planctomycetota bacterium]|nr:hypothetical protein [Planctomycetota bacterium]
MSSQRNSLLAGAAVGLACAGLLWVSGGSSVEASGPSLTAPAGSVPSGSNSLMVLREVVPKLHTEPSPSAVFLDDFFGDDAEEVRELLTAEGVDLETLPLPMPEADLMAVLPAWLTYADHERAAQRREKLQWPEQLTNEWLQVRYGVLVELGPQELETLDFLAELARPDIEVAIDRYLDELETAMLTEYMQGEVLISPFLEWPRQAAPTASDPDPAFYTMVRVGQGWVARVAVRTAANPAALSARLQIHEQVRKRDQRVREALLALQ